FVFFCILRNTGILSLGQTCKRLTAGFFWLSKPHPFSFPFHIPYKAQKAFGIFCVRQGRPNQKRSSVSSKVLRYYCLSIPRRRLTFSSQTPPQKHKERQLS